MTGTKSTRLALAIAILLIEYQVPDQKAFRVSCVFVHDLFIRLERLNTGSLTAFVPDFTGSEATSHIL